MTMKTHPKTTPTKSWKRKKRRPPRTIPMISPRSILNSRPPSCSCASDSKAITPGRCDRPRWPPTPHQPAVDQQSMQKQKAHDHSWAFFMSPYRGHCVRIARGFMSPLSKKQTAIDPPDLRSEDEY